MNSSFVNTESKDKNWICYCVIHSETGFDFAKDDGVCGSTPTFQCLDSGILILLILLCGYVWIKPKFDDHGSAHSFAEQIQQVA